MTDPQNTGAEPDPQAMVVDVEPVDEETPAADAAPRRRRRPGRSPAERRARLLVAVFGVVALLALAAAVLFATWWASLYNAERQRDELQLVAADFAVHLATFEGATIDEWVEQTQEQATGRYATEVSQLFDRELRTALRDAEVSSSGELMNIFIQELENGQATVFAIVRQEVTNRLAPQPVTDELRMELEFERVEGSWLVSNVFVLGPAPGDFGVPEQPEAEGASPDDATDGAGDTGENS